MIYFTSDLHLGHKAIPKYREPFETMEEHDEYILSKIESLGKRDILYILGDFLFDGPNYEKYIERLNNIACRIKLIMGNHDSLKLYKEDCIEMQLPLFSYKKIWLSHCPIHPNELRNRLGCIHGHMHLKSLDDERYFNVNLDVNDYEFVLFDTIREHFEKENK